VRVKFDGLILSTGTRTNLFPKALTKKKKELENGCWARNREKK